MATEFKAGDWHCAACGDHQFERNIVCRKCGAPKTGENMPAKNGVMGKAGDWVCPNPRCQDLQFGRNAVCRKCGTAKPGMGKGSGLNYPMGGGKGGNDMMSMMQNMMAMMGGSGKGNFGGKGAFGGEMPNMTGANDWKCIKCGDLQFGRNSECRKCGAAKPPKLANGQTAKPGDWICPNPECGDLQFERNTECRKCGTAKPEPDEITLAAAEKQRKRPPPLEDGQLNGDEKRARGNQIEPREGDWICPNEKCQDVQFERNKVCRRCGTAKPGEEPSLGEGGRPEDWNCAECGDHQFGRNIACRKCGAPKPTVASNNVASKKGDWICPNKNCQDVQFERNAQCRRCGTAKPIAAGGKGGGVGGVAGGDHMQKMMSMMQSMLGMSPGAMGKGMQGNRKPGDWTCPNPECGDHQFARNESCRKCGTPKPMLSTNGQSFKPGDWICPNPECCDVQFEKNTVCRKCQTPKPE